MANKQTYNKFKTKLYLNFPKESREVILLFSTLNAWKNYTFDGQLSIDMKLQECKKQQQQQTSYNMLT